MTTGLSARRGLPREMILDYLRYMAVTWLVVLGVVLAALLALDGFGAGAVRDGVGSLWVFVMQAAVWYVAGMAGYLTYWTPPAYVGNGRTRASAAYDGVLTLVAIVLAATLLIIAGFLIEYLYLGWLDWPQTVHESRLFTSHLDVPGIVAAYLPILLVGASAGAFVGVLTYRYTSWGWSSFVPALLLVIAYGVLSDNALGLLPEEVFTGFVRAISSFLAALVISAVFLLLAWLAVRTVPVRSG